MATPSPAIQQSKVDLVNIISRLQQEALERPPEPELVMAAQAAEEALAALDRVGGRPVMRPSVAASMQELWTDA